MLTCVFFFWQQVFRKAALKIVQDIGEPAVAEDKAQIVPPAEAPEQASKSSSTESSEVIEETVEKQDGEPASPAAGEATAEDRKTTTGVRKPLDVPSSVHVEITADNLLDYVGPPVYQKDRIYTKTSPVGVSCGLGYLGNGSGAVMPIEVTVSGASSVRLVVLMLTCYDSSLCLEVASS